MTPFLFTILSALGWSPQILKNIRSSNFFVAIFYIFIFLLDAADATFDILLSLNAIKNKTDNVEATLLLVMTIIGRIISGIHGQMSLDRGEDTLSAFTFMESSVFILEDGAAILFLAKRGNVEGVLEEASMYLTVVCGVGFMITWTMIVISQCFRCNSSLPTASLSTLLVPLGFATYLGFILTTETSLFGKIPDDNLIDTKDFVIYGIASAYMILISLEMYLRVEIVDSSDSSDHSEKSDGSPI